MSPVVECKAAWKRYGAVEALKGVNLTIQPGEVVAILGPNGAGKTTCMSLILGLRQPSAGEVRLFGLSPCDRRARSRCGVMLQDSGVSGVLTVRELVHLFQSYYPSALPTEQALAMAGLQAQAEARIATLSGGQLQRLYFALAVCGDPDVLFLDEPTVGMDVEARRAVLVSLQELAASGKTIVFTTHYLKEAEDLARRIVVIDHGLIIADATPQQLKARIPAKRLTFSLSCPLPEAVLQGLDVTTVEASATQVRLLTNAPELVLQALFQRGVQCQNLEVVGADLEEAFLALTERQARP